MAKPVSILDEVAKVKLEASLGWMVLSVMEPGFTGSFSILRPPHILRLRAPLAFDPSLSSWCLVLPQMTLVCTECESNTSSEKHLQRT